MNSGGMCMGGILFSFVLIIGVYIRRFDKDFSEEDKQKVFLFILAIMVVTIGLAFLRD